MSGGVTPGMAIPKQQDLVDVIIADHREVEATFDELAASGDARNRRVLVEHAIAVLVRHTAAEEQYLFPTVRRALPDGEDIADLEVGSLADTERLLKQLEQTDAADPRFPDQVQDLYTAVRRHVRECERDMLPRLRAACEDAELRELGMKFQQSKKMAPTRPHPATPNHPPMNKVADAGMGLIDRVRDTITGRDK